MGVLGLLGGVLTRLLPEAVKYFEERQKAKERERDREHELRILQMQMEQQRQGHTERMEAIGLEADVETFKLGLEATKPISGHLKTDTGTRWIDGTVALLGALVDVANAAVRPGVTFWWVGLYTLVKSAQYQLMVSAGAEWSAAVLALWTDMDAAVFTSIIGFWFTDRVLRKYRGV